MTILDASSRVSSAALELEKLTAVSNEHTSDRFTVFSNPTSDCMTIDHGSLVRFELMAARNCVWKM